MVSIGSKRPDAKTIKITFTKKHLLVGIIIAVIYLFMFTDTDKLFNYNVTCPNGDNQTIIADTQFICGEFVPLDMKPKEKIKYYNKHYLNEYIGVEIK